MGRHPLSNVGIGESSPPVRLIPGSPSTAELRLRTNYDSKIKIDLQFSTDLEHWQSLSSRSGTGPWIGAAPTVSNLAGGRALYRFNTGASPASGASYFLRLVAEETSGSE